MLSFKTRKFLSLIAAVVALAISFSGFKGNISSVIGGIGWLLLGFNYFMDYFQAKAEERMMDDIMKMAKEELNKNLEKEEKK